VGGPKGKGQGFFSFPLSEISYRPPTEAFFEGGDRRISGGLSSPNRVVLHVSRARSCQMAQQGDRQARARPASVPAAPPHSMQHRLAPCCWLPAGQALHGAAKWSDAGDASAMRTEGARGSPAANAIVGYSDLDCTGQNQHQRSQHPAGARRWQLTSRAQGRNRTAPRANHAGRPGRRS